MNQVEFRMLVPNDPYDIFYMHFELLRKTKVVAVVCDPMSKTPLPAPPVGTSSSSSSSCKLIQSEQVQTKSPRIISESVESTSNQGNQQIQLWQFLLELLTDPQMCSIISWWGQEGEFRLHEPKTVANLWGQRKNKPAMNYEKLSRALRYYYDGEILSKVNGRKFVYKFLIDFRKVIGYSATQLRQRVIASAAKEGVNINMLDLDT